MPGHAWPFHRTLSALAVLAALAAPALATNPRDAFKGDEAWMLSVILSDPDQKAAFDQQAAAAKDSASQTAFEQRWRKKIVDFAGEYHRHLTTTDILPNAPTIEKMVNEWEFAVMSHRLNHLPKEKQQEVLSDISDGNSALGWLRGTVEGKIRAKRKEAAADAAKYLQSPDAVAARSYVEKPPERALDQARQAADSGRAAQGAPSVEEATRRAGEMFTGTPTLPGDVPATTNSDSAVSVPPPGTPSSARTGLSPNLTASPGGGLRIAPPPSPILDREAAPKATKGGAMGVLVKKFAPAAGGILGAILGFILGGPIGALIGAAAGAALGFGAKKLVG